MRTSEQRPSGLRLHLVHVCAPLFDQQRTVWTLPQVQVTDQSFDIHVDRAEDAKELSLAGEIGRITIVKHDRGRARLSGRAAAHEDRPGAVRGHHDGLAVPDLRRGVLHPVPGEDRARLVDDTRPGGPDAAERGLQEVDAAGRMRPGVVGERGQRVKEHDLDRDGGGGRRRGGGVCSSRRRVSLARAGGAVVISGHDAPFTINVAAARAMGRRADGESIFQTSKDGIELECVARARAKIAALSREALAARGESRSYEGSTQSIRRTTLTRMAMGTRETDQPPLWIATSDLPTSPGHPFYARLTTLLDGHHFDRFVEGLCDRFYAPVMGRPSLAPGRYFRLLLVGYFEGIDSERGMAWRATDSLAVRSFLRLAVDEAPPDHSTIARTRRLIDLETHRTVFTWVQQRLVEAGRLTGKTIAIDATTLEANAAMRSIVRRDTGESYQAFLAGLAKASGIETPTREGLARLDRKRKKKTSNTDWTNPHDPDAKVTKMKDGRTHLAHKAEHAVDMETGAIVAVTRQGADVGDTTTIIETAIAAAEQVEDAQANVDDRQSLEEIVGDKGYHSNQTLIDLDAVGIRSYVSEPDRGRRDWSKDPEARAPVYGNRRRMRGRRGRRLMRQRGERIERSFAHLYDTGGMRRTHLRGHTNILKRLLIHAGGFNLGLVMRHLIGIGTPRGLQGRVAAVLATVRGAHGRRPTSAHHDFVVASTHPGRARSARVTGHVCRQLVSGDHLHHGLLGPRSGCPDLRGGRGRPPQGIDQAHKGRRESVHTGRRSGLAFPRPDDAAATVGERRAVVGLQGRQNASMHSTVHPRHVALLNRRQAGTGGNARVHAGESWEAAPLRRVAIGRAVVAGRRIALHAVRDGIHGVFQRVEQCVDGVVHPVRDGAPLLLQPILVALSLVDEDVEQWPSGLRLHLVHVCSPLLDQQRTVWTLPQVTDQFVDINVDRAEDAKQLPLTGVVGQMTIVKHDRTRRHGQPSGRTAARGGLRGPRLESHWIRSVSQ